RCHPPGLAELDPAGPAPVGRSDLVDPAAVAGPDFGSGHVAGAAAAPAGLAAAGSGPWSDRAAVVPGYAAGSDPACHDPAAPLIMLTLGRLARGLALLPA